MKKIMFAVLVLAMFTGLSAQRNIGLNDDNPQTLSGVDNALFTPPTAVETKAGIVGFQITYTGDTLKTVALQGSFDKVTYTTVTSNDKDAGTYWLVEDTPVYWYYRLNCTTASIDTVVITDVRFIYKEE